MSGQTTWLGDAVRGAIAGGAAVWLMDQVTTSMLQRQSEETTRREEAARPHGKPSAENLVDLVAERWHLDLDETARARATQAVHYGLGVVPGAIYGAARGRVPGIGLGRGLGYGLALFAINDELANTALGLAGPPADYPPETHLRGAVGHLVLGAVTDTGIDVLGG
jgi:hypothetical protein